MAFSVNRVTLVGNLTADPETRYTTNGSAVCGLRLATNRSRKLDDGSYEDIPTFHKIVVWNKLGEWVGQNCKKGQKVYIDGRIDNRSYEAEDGTTKYISEVVAENVIPMSGDRAQKASQTKSIDNLEDAYEDEPKQPAKKPATKQVASEELSEDEVDGLPF